jgi:hypothetical protein
MFRKLANGVIDWIISARIERLPDEPRRRYFRNMAWFCSVLALSEALFAFLILWGWLETAWMVPLLPALWLGIGAVVLFLVAAITFAVAYVARERAKV